MVYLGKGFIFKGFNANYMKCFFIHCIRNIFSKFENTCTIIFCDISGAFDKYDIKHR